MICSDASKSMTCNATRVANVFSASIGYATLDVLQASITDARSTAPCLAVPVFGTAEVHDHSLLCVSFQWSWSKFTISWASQRMYVFACTSCTSFLTECKCGLSRRLSSGLGYSHGFVLRSRMHIIYCEMVDHCGIVMVVMWISLDVMVRVPWLP